MELSKKYFQKIALTSTQLLRSTNYLVQYQLMQRLAKVLGEPVRDPQIAKELGPLVIEQGSALLKKDCENIVEGVYPAKVLHRSSPLNHISNLSAIFIDYFSVHKRKKNNQTTDLGSINTDNYPDYYKRNFHFQTDGYLSRKSAKLYNHQVEMLFNGTADAMRRSFISPLKELTENFDGKDQNVLEVACGTGSAARSFKLAWPLADITISDLSGPYLEHAKDCLSEFENINFQQADASKLPFRDDLYDVTYSIYLFHELPSKIRKEVILEQRRVLKDNGLIVIIDSMQLDDQKVFNEALCDFPKKYHEPFYKNYIENSIEELLVECGFEIIHQEIPFLSKCVIAKKA